MRKRFSTFSWVILTVVGIYLFLQLVVPYISKIITGKPNLLPVPETLFIWYIVLTILAVLTYVTSSDELMIRFLIPLKKKRVYLPVIILFPLLVGWYVYTKSIPEPSAPIEFRLQHPTIPKEFERLENPFRKLDTETQRKAVEEGIILYQKNCQPCHGAKADGNGPFADAFRLRPANFTDPGTLASVVEAYAFWRIKQGGPGLPSEATPWDSAMPSWKNDFTDEEIWKIIMAEYDIAGVGPRKPE